MLQQQFVHKCPVADVAMDKDMAIVSPERVQVPGVSGIGEQIQIYDGLCASLKPVKNEITANKAGAPGYKDSHIAFRSAVQSAL
jgi:hypothetical protein